MRIAHLIDALGWGGAQTLLLTFAESAQKYDVETMVIGVKPDRKKSPLPDLIRENGARVISLTHRKIYDPAAVPTIVRLLKKEKIELVHTHLSHSNIYGCFAGKIVHIPSVATLHNTHTNTYSTWRIRQSLEHCCLRYGVTRVIAVGQNVAAAYSSIVDPNKLDIIPNAVKSGKKISQEKKNALRSELMMGDSSRVLIVAVGRLTEQKGYYDMLTAFAQVCRQRTNTFLAIIGLGHLDEKLKEYASALNIMKNVHFVGSRADVPEILAASDIFLNASHWEGLSIAMLEAMAAGLPVIATKVGDAEKLLANGGGVLVDAKDVQSLTVALVHLLDDQATRHLMGNLAKEFVEENYSADVWFEKLLATYSRAISDYKIGVNPN